VDSCGWRATHITKRALCFLPWNLLNQYALLSDQRTEKLPGVLLINSGRACGFEELGLRNCWLERDQLEKICRYFPLSNILSLSNILGAWLFQGVNGFTKKSRQIQRILTYWRRLLKLMLALGNSKEAIQEGRRAMEMLPASEDAVKGPDIATSFAFVCAWANQLDLAFEQLNILVKIPAGRLNYGDLKTYPGWDPLRKDPRFDKLLAELAPKD
jgi:hypothetical protein